MKQPQTGSGRGFDPRQVHHKGDYYERRSN